MKHSQKLLILAGLAVSLQVSDAFADETRAYVSIVGSSSLAPYAEQVADQIAKGGKIKRPKLESTGTGGGLTLFCAGAGMEHPDLATAGRRIRQREFDHCVENGVGGVIEVKFGYDGAVVATHHKGNGIDDLTRKELYLALAKQVPDLSCKDHCEKLVPNPYKTWHQIDPRLPELPILVFGPPVTASIRDTFGEVVLEPGCAGFPWIAKQAGNEANLKRMCNAVREDGVYVEEPDEARVAALATNPDAVGLFGYQWLKAHSSRLTPAKIEGIEPTPHSIASQTYPIARPTYLYVKKAHLDRVSGLSQFVAEFTSERAWGDKGYMVAKGLIPMPKDERRAYAAVAAGETALLSLNDPPPAAPAEAVAPTKATSASGKKPAAAAKAPKAAPKAAKPAAKKG